MNQVLEKLKEASPAIRAKCNLAQLGVFGSYATKQNRPESDLDILYFLNQDAKVNFKNFTLLDETTKSLIGVEQIDLVNAQDINPLVWISTKDSIVYV
jgi:predicted nucleotidyltransferase